jgi:outer membrane protein assembly factor BamB
LYFITNDNKTYCLNTEDGGIKWIHYGINSTTKILGIASPVVYKEYVISSYSTGDLFILNKNSGKTVVSVKLTYKSIFSSNFDLTDIDSTPVIKDDVLIASANGGDIVAIDLSKMSIIWNKPISTLSNILINRDFIFILNTDNSLFILNIKNGDTVWNKQIIDDIKYKKLFFANNDIYVFNEMGYQVIGLDGNVKNKIEKKLNLYGNPISINGVFYGIGK